MDARRRYFTRLLDGEAAALALAGDTERRRREAAEAVLAGERGAAEGVAILVATSGREPDLLTLRAVAGAGCRRPDLRPRRRPA